MYYWILSDFTGGFDFFEENSCNLGWMGDNEGMKHVHSNLFSCTIMVGLGGSAKATASVRGVINARPLFYQENYYETRTNKKHP